MKQLTLWEEPQPILMHHHIEVVYLSGFRETICTAQPVRNKHDDYELEAGFVGGALPDDCQICHPKRESNSNGTV